MNRYAQWIYRKFIKHEKEFKFDELINSFTMEGALYRCKNRGIKINTVIDIGASNGSWSRICKKYIPDAHYLLIEAQSPHQPHLEKFKQEFINSDYVLAAAGKKCGTIYFDNQDLFGGLASDIPLENNCIEVAVTTIDEEIKKRGLRGPFLIKLDTHGFEIPILEGGQEALMDSNLVIIETYNYRLTSSSLKFYEMADYMSNKGFSTIEMVDFLLRKKDNSFWQMDTFFIPSTSEEFKNNSYL